MAASTSGACPPVGAVRPATAAAARTGGTEAGARALSSYTGSDAADPFRSPTLGNVIFLLLAALAGCVAGAAAGERGGRSGPEYVALASTLFLLQLGAFVLLAGLGAPPALAR